jgi:phosphoribosylcarboxyaminoimidazole (NCAIR) mutase
MITVQSDYFPIALIDMGRSPRTDQDFVTLFNHFDLVAKRASAHKTRYIIMATTQDTMSAQERRMLAVHANRLPKETMSLCICAICVLPRQTAILRGVLIALSWLIPVVPPLTPVATAEEGSAALRGLLRKHNLAVPNERVAACEKWMLEHAGRPAFGAVGPTRL